MRNGRRALARALVGAKRLDDVEVTSPIKGLKVELVGTLDELLFTDTMRRVVCPDGDFAFTGKNTKVCTYQSSGARRR